MPKPANIAASSAQAFTRHQNQRRMRTAPGPVPMAIMKRNTAPTSLAKNAATAASATIAMDARRPTATSLPGPASGSTKRAYRSLTR